MLVLYSQNIYYEYILGMLGSQERAATILIMGTLKDKCLKEDSWRKESEEEVFVSAKDKRFPKEIPKGQVPSDEKKCFSWGTVKSKCDIT